MIKMIKTAVIGHPVSHSKSPLIHNYWIRKYDLDGEYDAYDIAPESFEARMKVLIGNEHYTGFNITLPHKEAALDLCDEVDEEAKAIGAVNTIHVEDGTLKGMNTDVFGFMENIRAESPAFSFKDGPAVVLGAGGAARAVVHGLLKEGAPEVRLLNRTREKAETLATASVAPERVKALDWESRNDVLEGANILVNTTSLGMKGQPALEIDLDALPEKAAVNDIVYAPLQTQLLEQARARGNKVITGIGMLLHQARPGFNAWYGIMPDIDETLVQKVIE